MFEPRKLRVSYSVDKPDGEVIEFVIRLDEHGILEDAPLQEATWTRMEDERALAALKPALLAWQLGRAPRAAA